MSYPISLTKLQMSTEENLRRLAKYLGIKNANCEINLLISELETILNKKELFIPKNFPRL